MPYSRDEDVKKAKANGWEVEHTGGGNHALLFKLEGGLVLCADQNQDVPTTPICSCCQQKIPSELQDFDVAIGLYEMSEDGEMAQESLLQKDMGYDDFQGVPAQTHALNMLIAYAREKKTLKGAK